MKYFLALGVVFLLSFAPKWQNDFSKAKQLASTEHKFILLNFSGSDWCGPCMRMHKEIFGSETFTKYANDNLVVVNADFPRQKKNQLTKVQQTQNDQLADKYNSEGHFPKTLLLSADGKVVKQWDGLPNEGAVAFTNEVKQLVDAGK